MRVFIRHYNCYIPVMLLYTEMQEIQGGSTNERAKQDVQILEVLTQSHPSYTFNQETDSHQPKHLIPTGDSAHL